jgi:hypothetical protein
MVLSAVHRHVRAQSNDLFRLEPVRAIGLHRAVAVVRDKRRGAAVLIWALVRLPALAVLLYLLRHPILNAIERRFDIFYVTVLVVDVVSTPLARLISAAGLFAVLLLIVVCVRRLRPLLGYSILLVVAGVVIALSLNFAATSVRRALFVELILAVNLAPRRFVDLLKKSPRVWSALMLAGVGIVELFLWREYWRWVRDALRGHSAENRGTSWGIASTIPGLLLTCLVFAFVIRPQKVVAFEQMLRMSAEVQLIESGLSFNWIELDPTGTYLYVTGHDLPRLRRYDLRDLSVPPILSDVSTGGAQGFAYDSTANEIYAFNTVTRQLLYFDATTLERKRAVEVPDLSPGDPWVAVDLITDTLTLVSEADQEIGAPLIVLDRPTGRVLARADLAAGNVLLHPTKPWLYLTFFRRRNEVMLYNVQDRSVAHSAPADRRAERMVFSRQRNELLVTSPMESRIMRFDADQLHLTGYIPTMFGVRAIAIDEVRDLLLYGNIASGHLVVIDPTNSTRLRSYYLGPWLRTIELDVQSGIAYVSSRGALYRVHYAAGIPAR